MNVADSPIEWIPGRSLTRWFVGMELVVVCTLGGTYLLLESVLSSAGVGVLSPGIAFVVTMISALVMTAFVLLWGMMVPYPACRLGLSAAGVRIDYGARSELFPWDQVLRHEDRLISTTRRLRIPVAFSLTPYQAGRVAYLRPRGL
jgi:hypothetical protein